MKYVYILDTSALLSVQQVISYFSEPNSEIEKIFFTTPEIRDEFKDQFSKFRIDSMLSSEVLMIKAVDLEFSNYINNRCKEIGNFERLSQQDRSILSLAWQEKSKPTSDKIILLTDDFEIQNTAKLLKITFKSVKTRGITYTTTFKRICSACGEILDEGEISCPECGSTLIKRKSKKSTFKKK